MPTYGLTPSGFVIQPLESILDDDILTALRAEFGPSFAAAGTDIYKIAAVFAEVASKLWELAEAVNGGFDPDAASDAQLDSVCALTGTEREAERASKVALTLTGTPATTVPAGSRASAVSTGAEFTSLADGVIALLASWVASTAYVLGDRRTNLAGAWEVTVAGTSAGAGGPDPTGLDPGDTVTDNTVTWKYLGSGTGATDVDSEAIEVGSIVAVSGDIVTIETPVSGWSSVLNLLDADVGSDVETDESLRVSRTEELAAAGKSTEDAIRADLLDLEGVTSVKVFSNRTDTTDGDGVPPHSVEALVRGGDNQDIWDQLLISVSATSGTFGDETGTALDSEGNEHEMNFSRPEEIPIYVIANITVNAKLYPADGDEQVAAAIVAWGDGLDSGDDVHASATSAQAFQIPGVMNVVDLFIDDAPAPATSTSIPITTRQLGTFDTSRITINSTPGTP